MTITPLSTIPPLSENEVRKLIKKTDWKNIFNCEYGKAILLGKAGKFDVAMYVTGIDREIRVDVLDGDYLVWTDTSRDSDLRNTYHRIYDQNVEKFKERDKEFHNRSEYQRLVQSLSSEERDTSGLEKRTLEIRELLAEKPSQASR